MTAFYHIDWRSGISFFGVFLRMLGLCIFMPGFSNQSIPMRVKVILGFVISLALYPILRGFLPPVPETWMGITGMALRESVIGLLMGFTAFITFEGIRLAAQFVGYQMGFGTAGLLDPMGQSQVSVLVPLFGWIAIMVFFLTDMHHYLIRLFVTSFEVTHRHGVSANESLLRVLTEQTGSLFIIAIQMAAPFTILILCCNAVLGILSRMLPQMNVILFSFPVTILLGFCGLYVLAPEMLDYIERVLGEMSTQVLIMLKNI